MIACNKQFFYCSVLFVYLFICFGKIGIGNVCCRISCNSVIQFPNVVSSSLPSSLTNPTCRKKVEVLWEWMNVSNGHVSMCMYVELGSNHKKVHFIIIQQWYCWYLMGHAFSVSLQTYMNHTFTKTCFGYVIFIEIFFCQNFLIFSGSKIIKG